MIDDAERWPGGAAAEVDRRVRALLAARPRLNWVEATLITLANDEALRAAHRAAMAARREEFV